MLNQQGVIDAVAAHLERDGFIVEAGQRQSPNIVGRKKGGSVLVEARGQTSAEPTSSRFGEPFKRSQIVEHVAQKLYSALKLSEKKVSGDEIALAFPDDPDHQECLDAISNTLRKLGIRIYWVDEEGHVRIAA